MGLADRELRATQAVTRQATEDNVGHTEFLYRLLSDEVERRES